jgi:hypothetical protein
MAQGKSKNGRGDDLLENEKALARLYRESAKEMPPPELDDKILAAAHDAVETPQARLRSLKRWTMPLSAAALVVVSVGIVYELARAPVHERYEVSSAPANIEEAPAPLAKAAKPQAAPEARAKHGDGQLLAMQDAAKSETAPTTSAPAPASPGAAAPEPAPLRELAAPAPAEAERAAGAAALDQTTVRAQAAEKRSARVLVALTANVEHVSVRQTTRGYEFSVTIRSADTDCRRYTDWWEIVGADGKLLYRQTFTQPHTNEQPFTSTGKAVPIAPNQVVWVRAHLHGHGYGTAAATGSVRDGFIPSFLPADFAAELEQRPPQPGKCIL